MTENPTYEELEKKIQKLEQAESNLKHSKGKLIHSYDLMDYIISHARSAIAVFDRDLKYIYVSNRFLMDYKVKEQNVIGKHHYEVFPDLPQKWKDVHQRSLAGEVISAEKDPYYREDGSVKWTRWECRPWYESDGSIGGIIIYNEIINERKKIEDALRESEKKYRELADSLPQVVFEIDETGKIIYINKNAFDLFLYTKDEFDKGVNVIQVIIPEDRDRAIQNMQSVLNGVELGGLEYTALRHDGTTFPVLIHSNLVTHNAKPIGIRGLLIDISKQKKMEADLKRLALAIDYSSDTIVITDTRGVVIYANPAFEKITGYSRKEAQGKNVSIVQSGKHDKSFYRELWGTISNGKTWFGRFINKKKDGSRYIEDANISPVFSDKGKIVNYVAVKRDVTEKLKLEAQLQQALKMESIGTLAGGIAHDFNNILFPIVGYTEMLLKDIPENSPCKESLNQIYTSALRARSLVKQILTFSRQDSNELMLMKIQSIVTEALKLIRSTIPTTIEIKQDLNPDCGVIKADPTQIHQIVMNLATNAYHAMRDTGGELKVSLKEMEFKTLDLINPNMAPGIYACLTVADTGVGMDKNLINKIFDPFFTTKAIGKGTGMGLSVVHGIVTAMGGAIHVYSEPGKGTQFHVYLPVEKTLFEEQATTSKAQIQSGTEQILLVDDEEAILTMEKRMLARLGYQVTSHTGSLEALEAFRANSDKFDLVITDMAMPNMSGDKLSAELTKIRPDIPVLLCTGFSENMSEERAVSLGIKGFLYKPILMKDLSQKIREVLDKN
jgi:PAS domain S-box-containing protein